MAAWARLAPWRQPQAPLPAASGKLTPWALPVTPSACCAKPGFDPSGCGGLIWWARVTAGGPRPGCDTGRARGFAQGLLCAQAYGRPCLPSPFSTHMTPGSQPSPGTGGADVSGPHAGLRERWAFSGDATAVPRATAGGPAGAAYSPFPPLTGRLLSEEWLPRLGVTQAPVLISEAPVTDGWLSRGCCGSDFVPLWASLSLCVR